MTENAQPEPLACSDCGWSGTAQTATVTRSGAHLRADCPDCGRYIKFIAQGRPATIYFGKYAGQFVTDIATRDPAYLRWAVANLKLSERLRSAIAAALGEPAA